MKINLSNIKKAKNLLNKSECVAIPTETVYGLAGNAYSDQACRKIFRLKKRPKNNPLIVHYYDLKKVKKDCILNNDPTSIKIFDLTFLPPENKPYCIGIINSDFFCFFINFFKNMFVSLAILFNSFCILF